MKLVVGKCDLSKFCAILSERNSCVLRPSCRTIHTSLFSHSSLSNTSAAFRKLELISFLKFYWLRVYFPTLVLGIQEFVVLWVLGLGTSRMWDTLLVHCVLKLCNTYRVEHMFTCLLVETDETRFLSIKCCTKLNNLN